MAGKLAELWVAIGAKLDGFNKAMGDIERASQRIGKRLESVGKKMTIAISLPLAAIGGASIKMAMDAVESENLFTESMKGMADSAREWSNKLRNELGLNAYEVRKQVGTFHVMLKSMGLTEKGAYDMAKSLTQLAYDMASFYNLRPEEAFDKIKSSIVGMPRPLMDLGIVVNDTAVKTWALTNGVIEQGQALTDTQKILGRFNVIMEQTKTAQGDLGRTLESPANRLRVVQTRAKELGIEFGMRLLPIFIKLLEAANTAITIFGKMNDTMGNTVVVVGAVAIAMGPLVSIYAKLLIYAPLLNKALIGQRVAFIASAGGAALLLAALGAIVYGYNKVKEAQDALAEAEKRELDVSKQAAKKFYDTAYATGMTTKEAMKLADAYNRNYGALLMAIRKGKEGKELQEALAQVSAKHKEKIDKQRESLGGLNTELLEYMKSLGGTKEEVESFTDYLRDIGIMTLQEKAKRVEQLSGYMGELEEYFKSGKLMAEDYAAAIKKIREEIVELTEYLRSTALPTHKKTTGILENAQEQLEANIFGYKTFKDQVAEWALGHGDAFQNTMDDILKYSAQVNDIFNQLYCNQMMRLDNEQHRRREAIENSRMDEEQKAKALEALENEMDKRRREAARKQAARSKMLALFEAIVNTASAVVEALPNIPLSILVAALGAAQIAAIAAAPLPSLQKGGLIPEPMPVFAGHGPKGEIIMSPERIARIIAEEMPKLYKMKFASPDSHPIRITIPLQLEFGEATLYKNVVINVNKAGNAGDLKLSPYKVLI